MKGIGLGDPDGEPMIDALDWGYMERQLKPLAEAKEAPDILARLARRRGG